MVNSKYKYAKGSPSLKPLDKVLTATPTTRIPRDMQGCQGLRVLRFKHLGREQHTHMQGLRAGA